MQIFLKNENHEDTVAFGLWDWKKAAAEEQLEWHPVCTGIKE